MESLELPCPRCDLVLMFSPKTECPVCEMPLTIPVPTLVADPRPLPPPPGTPVATTTKLEPIKVELPGTVAELVGASRSSFAGWSAISTYLGCPERSRLKALGVRRKGSGDPDAEPIRHAGRNHRAE